VAVMGASPGIFGTARAQYHLRQMFVFLNMHPINRSDVMIGNAPERFDQQGNLIDPMDSPVAGVNTKPSWQVKQQPMGGCS
jgi:NAD(P)H-dependent FMN reductase